MVEEDLLQDTSGPEWLGETMKILLIPNPILEKGTPGAVRAAGPSFSCYSASQGRL